MKKIYFLIAGVLFFGQAVAAPEQPAQQRRTATSSTATQSRATRQPAAVAPATTARQQSPEAPAPVVTARAAIKQNVVQQNVAVAAANANTTVSEECKSKYYGCMDSFCMLDNENGGRCLCSDKKSDLDKVLAEIEKLDAQSRNMATTGVEKISLGSGDKANYVLDATNAAAKEFTSTQQSQGRARTRQTLDLSIFDAQPTFGFDEDEQNADMGLLKDKTGDALHTTVRDICTQQIPECAKDTRMLQMMYAQTIQSDCRAYENYLKKMKDESAKKLQVAEKALRDAALEAYENSNKWDLGQCVVEMRKCMQDDARGACGNDWTGCVGIVAAENARSGTSSRNQAVKMFDITGSATKIQIAASTYDAILSKKPICESITQNCVAAVSKDPDAVWNTFLREVAPALKSAELLAESNRRTSCIGNISECFKKGCADTMADETSYDLCLSRPETMLNICKVQLNECGISTTSATEAQKSTIWNFVTARLAAMRIDSCTKEVKDCLQSDDRCGEDYTKCVGLDMNNILAMCPKEKLVACAGNTQQSYIDKLDEIVTGILLGVDNAMQNVCQVAAEEKMAELRNEEDGQFKAFSSETFGTEGVILDTSNPNIVTIRGLIDFTKLTHNNDVVTAGNMTGTSASISNTNMKFIATSINNVISQLKSDPTINDCVNGRNLTNIRGNNNASNVGRFPNLLDSYILEIINSGLNTARDNYNTKVNDLKTQAMSIAQKKSQESTAPQCISPYVLKNIDAYKDKVTIRKNSI